MLRVEEVHTQILNKKLELREVSEKDTVLYNRILNELNSLLILQGKLS